MCEHSAKLVAWMDREVEPSQAAGIEQHLASCAECRSCVADFRKVSGTFDEYCEELVRAEEGRKAIRLQPVLWAAAAAVLLSLILAYSRLHVAPTLGQPSRTAMAGTNSLSPTTLQAQDLPARVKPDLHQVKRAAKILGNTSAGSPRGAARDRAPANAESESARWTPEEPTVQIAIPASAMFPPGAVPEGMSFVADLSIAADGSARQVLLQPQISEFQRRGSQQ